MACRDNGIPVPVKEKSVMNFKSTCAALACLCAWSAAAQAEAPPAGPESIELHGTLVLQGALRVEDLREYALANCDRDLSSGDIAAVQAWILRMGINCDAPQ
jgi:hypothetical protein